METASVVGWFWRVWDTPVTSSASTWVSLALIVAGTAFVVGRASVRE